MSENKEELEKKTTDDVNQVESVGEKKQEDPKVEEKPKDEIVKDSEEYYDELDHQEKD